MKNSRNTLAILFFLYSMVSMAQVGIGTITPGATLDITATSLTGTTVDGLLVPRVSRLRAQSMTGTPTSTVLYVNDVNNVTNGPAAGTAINVDTVGFYFFNGTLWVKLGSGATNSWNITGNSGLSGTTNFLGTTDAIDLAFRRNNAAAGKIGATSTGFGVNALTNGVATNNAAFGTNALALSTGADNVAFGNGTLSANVTGIQNTGIGNSVLPVNTGSANTAVGNLAMAGNTTGTNGTAVGYQALAANTISSNATAIGFQALMRNTAAANTAVGFQALSSNIGATQNTAVGYRALSTSNATWNTAVGYAALEANSVGTGNTAMGNFALGRNLGAGNTAMGHEAMFGGTNAFNNTTAIGWHALFANTADGSTAVGHNALQQTTSASGNTAVGASALRITTGAGNTALGYLAGDEHGAGASNTYIGTESGRYNTAAAADNVFIGYYSGRWSSGSSNVAIGSNALRNIGPVATGNNVAIGYNALVSNAGTGNVAIGYSAGSAEAGSNKLYITNSATTATTSLIYGEFTPAARILRTNSTFQIGDPAGTGYVFPAARGTINQMLQTNGAGVLSWVSPSAIVAANEIDPQVSSATNNFVPRWNTATTTLVDGVIQDNGTNVGIGGAPTAGNKLEVYGNTNVTGNANVTGNTSTTNFQMTSGATNGYILQSDAAGNASWVANPATTLSLVRANLSANQALTTTGWQKINFNTEVIDTANEFDTATGRFTATKAGFYRVTAVYHTNPQTNTDLYSIGIEIGATDYYQITSHNHSGVGNVERSVTCIVQLAVGGYVEVFAENFASGVDIDSFFGKTTFEIQQIR